MRRHAALVTGLLAVVAALAGCKNHDYYGTANVSEQAGDPRAELNVNIGVWIPEGSAASAHINLVGVNGTDFAGNVVSMNPNVLGIFHTPGDPGKYVFLGTSGTAIGYNGQPGQAEIVISIDGVNVRSAVGIVVPPSSEDAGEDASTDAEVGDGSDSDAQDASLQDADDVDAGDGG